jgi:hypothetical protein
MRVLRVVRFIVGMVVGLMVAITAMTMMGLVGTVIGLYPAAPGFALAMENIGFLAGWVGGSWLIFHYWQLPVPPVALTVPPDQWGQCLDQDADR